MVSLCELCGAEADLHCAADSAFLCRSCDAKFHASNVLFARHFRRIICPNCKSLTQDLVFGSLLPWPLKTTCCSTLSSSSSSASSSCSSLYRVSSSEQSSTTRVVTRSRGRKERVKTIAVADRIFVNWCDKLGIDQALRNAVVSYASLALTVEKRPRLRATTKVILAAAAFWFGVKNTMKRPSLKKVEDITGVGAGMIRAVESKLARVMTLQLRRWRVDSEEGWAENDNV